MFCSVVVSEDKTENTRAISTCDMIPFTYARDVRAGGAGTPVWPLESEAESLSMHEHS